MNKCIYSKVKESELASGNHICDFPQSVRLLIQSELASLIQSEQATSNFKMLYLLCKC